MKQEGREMSDSKVRVREITQSVGLTISDDRLEQLAQALEQALAEAEIVRQQPTPWPAPSRYDAAWSPKR